jgi:hypothetical protein
MRMALPPWTRAAGAGLLFGVLVVSLLPASWLFVPDSGPVRADGSQYACPMFCVVMDSLPGDQRCPVCGMELDEVSGESKLTRAEQRMVGLEVDRLGPVPLVNRVRVVGEVTYDETLVSRITTRMAGWLTKVHVDTDYTAVTKGAALAEIYSPDLFTAQKEYLVAVESGDRTLLDAATRRLRLLGIAGAEIEEIRKAGKARESVTLRAPRTGVVVARSAIEGAAFQKGATLYAVADLRKVWVQAQVYERDLPLVRVGRTAKLEVDGSADTLTGVVTFVDPVIDKRTRTARARIEVGNEDGALRIGQRADVRIESALADGTLALPKSAVLRTGERSIVYALFTERVPGKRVYALDPANLPETVLYELVAVRVGPLARRADSGEAFYPILDAGGLSEGTVVVTSGNLLLDSQAQLSGKPSLLFPEGNRGGDGSHSGH